MKSIYSKATILIVICTTLLAKAGDPSAARVGQADFPTVEESCTKFTEHLQELQEELKKTRDEETRDSLMGDIRREKKNFEGCKFTAFSQSLSTALRESNRPEGANAVKTAIDYLSRHQFNNRRDLADSSFFGSYNWREEEKAIKASIRRVFQIEGAQFEITYLTVVLRIGNAKLLELLLKNSPPGSGKCLATMSKTKYDAFAMALIPLSIPGLLLAGKGGPEPMYTEYSCLTAKEFAVGLGARKGSPILSVLNKYSAY